MCVAPSAACAPKCHRQTRRSQSNVANSQQDHELVVELEALQAIGLALARVQDPKTRQRILQWATERFCEGAAPAVDVRNAATPDPSLTVDALDLFGETAPLDEMDLCVTVAAEASDAIDAIDVCHAEAASDDQSLDSLLRAFAGDIRRLAALWQAA